jgi:hypothetical protein
MNRSMHTLAMLLKLASPFFVAAGTLHGVLGVGADVLLGARLPPEALSDPVLDSQNRFYGVAFMLYGALLWLCATDLDRYATVLRCLLWVFFAAGAARLVSAALHGIPPPAVIALLASELLLPPALSAWLSRRSRSD